MNKKLMMGATALLVAGVAQAAVIVTTQTIDDSATAGGYIPTVSSTDLAQTQFGSYTATSTEALATRGGTHLFNGVIGIEGGNAAAEGQTRIDTGDTFTLTFDTSVNTLGYDLTGIDSYFGWATGSGGRSDQGFSIDLGFVGGGAANFVAGQHWENNDPTKYWTIVSLTESAGGVLNSDTVNLNGAGAIADFGVIATGVESITITYQNLNDPTVGREVDIFGTATIPEPATLGMVALFGGGILFIRRRFMI